MKKNKKITFNKKYIGYYKNGIKDGFGIFINKIKPKLNVYIGFWKRGEIHGVGIRIKKRKVFFVLYKNGKKIKEIFDKNIIFAYLKKNNFNHYYKLFNYSNAQILNFVNDLIYL